MKLIKPNFWLESPKLTLFCWLALAILVGVFGIIIGTRTIIPGPTNINSLLKNKGERSAYAAEVPPKDILLVVIGHKNLKVSSEKFKEAREALVDSISNFTSPENLPIFEQIQTAGHTMLGDEHFTSKDERYLLMRTYTHQSVDRSAEHLKDLPKLFADWKDTYPDFSVTYLSDATVNKEMFELIDQDLDKSLVYTLPITFLILIWAFGSVVASLIPVFIAVVSLFMSLGVSAFISHFSEPISATASQLVVLLVLAVGIDYSLFIISRIREEVCHGASYREAIIKARKSTGLAVLWSGLIVALSLSGLFLLQDTVLASMAIVSIISVLITVLSAVFVLPSILLLLKEKIEYGKIWQIKGNAIVSKINQLWLNISVKRPVFVMLLTVIGLIWISHFVIYMQLGSTVEFELFPKKMQSRHAFETLEKKFPDLAGSEFSIILESENLEDYESMGELQPFMDELHKFKFVNGPVDFRMSQNMQVARYQFISRESANSDANQNLIHNLRNIIFPKFLSPLGIEAHISGILPYIVDDRDRYSSRSPIVFGAVLLLSFIFLLVAFRSLIVPIKAILLNILSTLAAFGMLVLTFQLSDIVSLDFGVIESFVPPLLFSILFGLSMDYHVFLLSRVYEEYLASQDMKASVKRGIETTFRTITSAAAIMVSVFIIIAGLELPIMKQLGFGLAVAIFIDATIIRCLLLPASLVLLGKWNWYLPKFLSGLPRIKLE